METGIRPTAMKIQNGTRPSGMENEIQPAGMGIESQMENTNPPSGMENGNGAAPAGMENGNAAGSVLEWSTVTPCSRNDSLLDNISTPPSSDSEPPEDPPTHDSLDQLLAKK